MNRLIYTFGVRCYAFFIAIASIWSKKARLWRDGRRDWKNKIPDFSDSNICWFHCASLGEFEQGFPLMKKLKEKGFRIVVSFFSPSGYEQKKDHPIADFTFYLPLDTVSNSRFLLNKIKPKVIFFVKYEFWANLILEAERTGAKTYLVSGLFRKNQIFFKAYGGFMRKVLGTFDKIFVQNNDSMNLLKQINIDAIVTGDTRFDRVLSNLKEPINFPKVEQFIGGRRTIICGSVWEEDLRVIAGVLNESNSDTAILVVPHNVDEQTIDKSFSYFESAILFSQLSLEKKGNVLIIDNIGMLQHLYKYGELAYVGGGFKTGLHNILEPAVFGLPVIFGDKVDKFPEAKEFQFAEIGFSISTAANFRDVLIKIRKTDLKDRVKEFVAKKSGATEVILKEINIF